MHDDFSAMIVMLVMMPPIEECRDCVRAVVVLSTVLCCVHCGGSASTSESGVVRGGAGFVVLPFSFLTCLPFGAVGKPTIISFLSCPL